MVTHWLLLEYIRGQTAWSFQALWVVFLVLCLGNGNISQGFVLNCRSHRCQLFGVRSWTFLRWGHRTRGISLHLFVLPKEHCYFSAYMNSLFFLTLVSNYFSISLLYVGYLHFIFREFMKGRKRLQHMHLLNFFYKLKKNQLYAWILGNLNFHSNLKKFIQRFGEKKGILFADISISLSETSQGQFEKWKLLMSLIYEYW